MLLVIDVGNTNTVVGAYEGDQLITNWRLSTERNRTIDEYGILFRNLFSLAKMDSEKITGIAISSVVPPLNFTLTKMSENYFGLTPYYVDHTSETGMPIRYQPETDVGADRIVNSVAAIARYGTPCTCQRFALQGALVVAQHDLELKKCSQALNRVEVNPRRADEVQRALLAHPAPQAAGGRQRAAQAGRVGHRRAQVGRDFRPRCVGPFVGNQLGAAVGELAQLEPAVRAVEESVVLRNERRAAVGQPRDGGFQRRDVRDAGLDLDIARHER